MLWTWDDKLDVKLKQEQWNEEKQETSNEKKKSKKKMERLALRRGRAKSKGELRLKLATSSGVFKVLGSKRLSISDSSYNMKDLIVGTLCYSFHHLFW